jgi:GT2 family glycosyltransferase
MPSTATATMDVTHLDSEVDTLIHHLNQRYRAEFDRAEALAAKLHDIEQSRWWPWFQRMRRLSGWARGATPLPTPTTDPSLPMPLPHAVFTPRLDHAWTASDVSIIIPFRDQAELLQRCVASLHRTVPKAELVLVDNGSVEFKTKNLLHRCRDSYHAQVVNCDEPFNFARLCNAGAAVSHRQLLLFLNNDVIATQPRWLEAMLELANDSRVGITGATLLYPDRTIQHAGITPTGPAGTWEHPYRHESESHSGLEGELRRIRTVPAVTGACLLIHRKLFEKVGGFDPCHAVIMNDVDLCERVKQLGLEVTITPFARLVHFESISRGYSHEVA